MILNPRVLMTFTAIVSLSVAVSAGGLRIGPKASVFYPSDKKTRNAFGGTWYGFGLGPVGTTGPREKSRLDSDLRIMSRDSRGNRFFMLSPSVGPMVTLGDPNQRGFVPYAAVRVGPAYFDYAVGSGNARIKKKRLGFNLNAEVGATLSDSGRLSLRYDTMSRFDGFKFDGLSLEFMFSLGRL